MLRDKCSLKRKTYQRAANSVARRINKSIQNDWLWDGRFYVRQAAAGFFPYHDGSGAEFWMQYECHDRKTGKVEYRWFNNYDLDYRLPWWVNECITNYWDVWHEIPNPNELARLEGRMPIK